MKKKTTESSQTKINPIDAYVGSQLRMRRILMGWSQGDLADKVGLTFQQIQKYENGKNRISASRLYEFGLCLDVPVAYFFESVTAGTYDNTQNLAQKNSDDIFNSKETLELIKAFYSFNDAATRDRFLKLLKSIAADRTKKN